MAIHFDDSNDHVYVIDEREEARSPRRMWAALVYLMFAVLTVLLFLAMNQARAMQ
jgi:hypothetical protein